MNPNNIRNFCIIAHIDHGKSTLSDRILEQTSAVDKRKMQAQMLDSLDIERERGITVKSATASLNFTAKSGETYRLNLIDTPGHVDFSYEVSRSLAACEGALLVVDAAQGIEAQTLANFYLALESELEILPVVNKIDLPSADLESVSDQIEKELGLDKKDIAPVSAKNGIGIDDLLEKLVAVIPPPPINDEPELKALIFDSFFDAYRGAIVCVRVFNGNIKPGDKVTLVFNQKRYTVEEVGLLGIQRAKGENLSAGEVGYVILGIKSVSEITSGDTITHTNNPTKNPLPGYKEVKPMVFAGIFPIDADDYNDLADAMEKLKLNDAALTYQKENSLALGFGFRCGFLGVLHMEIIQERLLGEFGLSTMLTAPSVQYLLKCTGKEEVSMDNPADFPDPSTIDYVKEPFIKASIIAPADFLGSIIQLVNEKRGIQKTINYLDEKRLEAIFELPFGEVVFDFYDRLKSVSKGYASLDYEFIDHRETIVSKVEILVNKEPVDALSFLVHRDKARERGKHILEKLKEEIHRHMFAIPLQATIGSNVIARENIAAMRKDVTAKCYGGDISRKRKLLEKQKEGKKKMKAIGNVEIPQKAFLNVLKSG